MVWDYLTKEKLTSFDIMDPGFCKLTTFNKCRLFVTFFVHFFLPLNSYYNLRVKFDYLVRLPLLVIVDLCNLIPCAVSESITQNQEYLHSPHISLTLVNYL